MCKPRLIYDETRGLMGAGVAVFTNQFQKYAFRRLKTDYNVHILLHYIVGTVFYAKHK